MRKITIFSCLLAALLAFGINDVFGQIIWTKDARNPILSGGGNGTWNKHVWLPSILFNADSTRYEMWFGASAGPVNDEWRPFRIGYAVSDDGITWTMHPDPVLSPSPGTWDENTVEAPSVIRENGQYKMWYTSSSDWVVSRIGYATSPDGINWAKYPGNPVLGPGTSAWEAAGPYGCNIIPVAGGYKMWYGAFESYNSSRARIGYATSVDGIFWQRDTLNNPVLTLGASGQWDDCVVLVPQIIYADSTYYMWYCGAKIGPSKEQIGLATSPDGINFTKYAANPVLALSPGEWDADFVESGTVLIIRDTLHLWYAGTREPGATYLWRIGHATLPLDTLLEYTGINDSHNTFRPEGYSLAQNYPNPFNPSTTIEFSLPKSEFTTLKVYNILGKEVSTIISKTLNSGNHIYNFDGSNLASGIYYYQLVAGEYREVKKMILLK